MNDKSSASDETSPNKNVPNKTVSVPPSPPYEVEDDVDTTAFCKWSS